ncbi:MAG: hypothetical protein QN174_04195 [Armatimonadota bacterium]|nr:hypothetical protein [Armatimonadota bacterium]MDR7454726.1 hypothetical protein [Armatimonadota bacterium]MDR7496142.1 hypothetical protein [Armatimonadota bacterium]MDR7512708.1 hypothetical protein [Armatimonadota bacterium]
MVDVIIVPDFSAGAVERFEVRTLLFLGSWLRHGGASRAWPLHVACIGAPPASVRRLAERAGASVTAHAPMPEAMPRTANKLRGLEVRPRADRFLLLDADVLVLADLTPLADAVGDAVGAGPATFNHVPVAQWRRMYDAVGVPYPGPAGACWHTRWDLSAHERLTPAQREQCRQAPPYHNGGVVMAPWSSGLAVVWRRHLLRLLETFAADPLAADAKWRRHGDQHALATAIEALRRQGAPVTTLPLAFQARPPVLVAGVVRWHEVALFHYVKVLRPYDESVAGVRALLYGRLAQRLRRRRASVGGLRAALSPVLWRVPRRHRCGFGPFFEEVHGVFDQFGL